MDQPNASPVILVVDDEVEVAQSIRDALCRANYTCRCCRSFDEALSTAEAALPNLLVTNVWLRNRSGHELCRQLLGRPQAAGMQVMFLSSLQSPDIIRRNDCYGGTYYIRKPIDLDVLSSLVDKVLAPHSTAVPPTAAEETHPAATGARLPALTLAMGPPHCTVAAQTIR